MSQVARSRRASLRDARAISAAALVSLGLAFTASCQSRTPPPAPTAAEPAAPPAPPRGSDIAAVPAHIRLPRSPPAPAKPTSRPLARAELDRLAATQFPDFEHQVLSSDPQRVQFRYVTATRPKLAVVVAIEPCLAACPPMELAAWQARAAELRRALPAPLRDRPDTKFELGTRDVAGALAIYTYQLGWAFDADARGGPSGAYSDVYALHYNDGVNQIRVHADYADDAVGGIEQMLAVAPKADLERLAASFLAYFLHAW